MRVRLLVLRMAICWVLFIGPRRPSPLAPELRPAYWAGAGGADVARSTRGWLYYIARLMGDLNAVKKGRIGRRIGRRMTGKATGRSFRRLFG